MLHCKKKNVQCWYELFFIQNVSSNSNLKYKKSKTHPKFKSFHLEKVHAERWGFRTLKLMCDCNLFPCVLFSIVMCFFTFLQSTDVARSYTITYDVRDIDSKLCGVIRNDNLTSRKYNGQRPNHDFNSYLQHVRVEKSSLKLQLTILYIDTKFNQYLFYNDYEKSYTTYINHARWYWCLCSGGLRVGGNRSVRRKPTCLTWWPHDHISIRLVWLTDTFIDT